MAPSLACTPLPSHTHPPPALQPTGKEGSAVSAAAASTSGTATMAAPAVAAAPPAPPPPPPQPDQKPAHDVVAGAMARAASQSTIHPLDTMKVRMQAGRASSSGTSGGGAKPAATLPRSASGAVGLERRLSEVKGLYKVSVGHRQARTVPTQRRTAGCALACICTAHPTVPAPHAAACPAARPCAGRGRGCHGRRHHHRHLLCLLLHHQVRPAAHRALAVQQGVPANLVGVDPKHLPTANYLAGIACSPTTPARPPAAPSCG